jgi:hypothetical protein
MKSIYTFVSGFHRLQPDLRMDDLVTTLHSLYLASSTVWKSKRIEIQLKFGLFQWANMTIKVLLILYYEVKAWLILVG